MATFPTTIPASYSLIEIPEFKTKVIKYQNKVEQRIAQYDSPQWHFKLTWENLNVTDKQTLQDFFIACLGSFTSFTLTHPTTAVTYTVRFVQDIQDFELFQYNLWKWNSVELLQVPA